jgi:hypothetical protein
VGSGLGNAAKESLIIGRGCVMMHPDTRIDQGRVVRAIFRRMRYTDGKRKATRKGASHMVDNKITKQRIKNHFAYSRWKYILLAVVCVIAWDLIYSMTEYRPPREKRVHIYALSAGADNTQLQEALAQPVLDTLVDTEEVQFYAIGLTANGDYTAEMQFTTYMGAQEGDVFLCPSYKFNLLAGGENGVFAPLEGYIQAGVIDAEGLDLSRAMGVDEEGVQHVYGIPMDSLYGLLDYNIDPAQMYLCIPLYSMNMDNAARAIGTLQQLLDAPKPDWYDDYKTRQIESSRPDSLIYD